MSDETNEVDMKRLDEALNTVLEHFDTVQIFATRHDPATDDGTLSFVTGKGNWYARYAVVREWIVKQDERARQTVRRDDSA